MARCTMNEVDLTICTSYSNNIKSKYAHCLLLMSSHDKNSF